MANIQQPKYIKLFTNQKVKIPNQVSVVGLLKKCAEIVDIAPEFFHLFRLVQKGAVVLALRRKLPPYVSGTQPLQYRVVDFNFDVENCCSMDSNLTNYLRLQIMHDVMEELTETLAQDLIMEFLALDVVRFGKSLCHCDIEVAYRLYFVLFDGHVSYKADVLRDKVQDMWRSMSAVTEAQCLLRLVKLYVDKVYPTAKLIKRIFTVKSSSFPVLSKMGEKLNLTIRSSQIEITTAREASPDKMAKLQFSEIHHIQLLDKCTMVLSYGETKSLVSLSFKSVKHVDTFASLCQYYYYPLHPSRILFTKCLDVRVDETAVTYSPSERYNLVGRSPLVSFFTSYDLAEQCLHKIPNCRGWFKVTAVSNPQGRRCYCLSYSILNMVKRTLVHCIDGMFQIGASVNDEQKRFSDIADLVSVISPSIDGEKQRLLNSLSDHMIIDVLTVSNFSLNIPQSFISLTQPPIHANWCYKILSGTFEDFSGNRSNVKFLEFSQFVRHTDIMKLVKSLRGISSESIVKYTGICKVGANKKIITMLEFNKIVLQTFFSANPSLSIVSKLQIGQYLGNTLKWLHEKGISHSCPSPLHILVCPHSLQIQLFDIGLVKSYFARADWESNPIIQKALCKGAVNDLRWLPSDVLIGTDMSTSSWYAVDRWVFGCTLWQIFNNGKLPLHEYTDEELITRYKDIKKYHLVNNDRFSNLSTPVLWYRTELLMPNQRKVLNAKLQRLINRILYNQNDEVDDLEEIVELYNKFIYPPDSEPDFYEDLKDNTDIIIRKSGGKLVFEEQVLEENLLNAHSSDDEYGSYDEIGDPCEGHLGCDDYSSDFSGAPLSTPNNHVDENVLLDDAFVDYSNTYNPALLSELSKFNAKHWDASTYTLGEVVGKGNFGTVQKATIHEDASLPVELHGIEVAVKIFHVNNSLRMDAHQIFTEAKSMASLNHEGIVPFLGISLDENIDGQHIHIIMPFYKLGSLKNYIGHLMNNIKTERLMSYGLQIAEGMKYLSSKGFVHRDLALRNILVEQANKIRIADLGLCREVSADYYYILQTSGSGGLPYLSYPLEFFRKLKFDKFCDVWSYGVTCYEMFSYGQTPYKAQGITNKEMLIKFLESGRTLEIPERTPSLFEYIMKKCWLSKKERWTFSKIVDYIVNNVTYHNPFVKIRKSDYEKFHLRDDIVTEVMVDGGSFRVDRISTRYLNNLKLFTTQDVQVTEGLTVIEYRGRDVPYDKLQIRTYDIPTEPLGRLFTLSNWNIGQIIGYQCIGPKLHTFSPYLCLGTLQQFCRRNNMQHKIEKKYIYLKQVLDGLLFLLSEGITHGSLNINNVYLQTKDRVVLYDVGLKTSYSVSDMIPSLVTLPPEAIQSISVEGGVYTTTMLSDTWMYGILLWEMFSTSSPYQDVR